MRNGRLALYKEVKVLLTEKSVLLQFRNVCFSCRRVSPRTLGVSLNCEWSTVDKLEIDPLGSYRLRFELPRGDSTGYRRFVALANDVSIV